MLRRRLIPALAAIPLVILAIGGTAAGAAATYRIQLDAQPPDHEPWSFSRYFPAALTVHQGDIVDAAWGGADTPHTATVVPSDNPDAWRAENQGPSGPQDPSVFPYALTVPDTTVGGDDASELVINPAVAAPSDPTCGTETTPCAFDGSSVVTSGFQFSNPAAQPSFSVQVNAPVGNYTFLCLVHPGMQEALHVVSASTSIDSPAQVATQVTNQIDQATKVDGETADALAQTKVRTRLANGHSRWTIWAGGFWNQVTANEYPDSGLKLRVGDKIKVLGNFEIHTATIPKSSFKSVPFITTQCEVAGPDTPATSPADCTNPGAFQSAFNAQALLPTNSNKLVDPSTFVNSGLLENPGSGTFVARKPGVYTLVCLVHGPEMSTKITVES